METPESGSLSHPWYTFFFGMRGLLRMFSGMLTLLCIIVITCSLGSGPAFSARLVAALKFTYTQLFPILTMTVPFSIMVWFALHVTLRREGWRLNRTFGDCEGYDWWGRRAEEKRRS